MANNKLILAGSHGEVMEISADTGETSRIIKTKKNVQISPVIANGMLFLLAEDGTLSAYQ